MATKTPPKKPGAQWLTVIQTCALFGVTAMCLGLWRKGTATKSPLPCTKETGGRGIKFTASKLERWAAKNGVALVRTVEDVLQDESLMPRKPGPRTGG